jgi:MFS family permease
MSIHAVLLIVVLNMTSFRASKMLVSLFAIELQASQFMIGVLIALYSLFPVVLALYAGKLTDRLGVRLPMVIGSAGFAAALLIPFLFPVLASLYASAIFVGVFHMMYNVAVQNLVGSLGGAGARARNFSNYSLAMAIGVFIGPMIAGYAIDQVGHAYGYLCVSFLPLIPALMMVRANDMTTGPRVESEEEKAVMSASLLANPVLRRTLITSAIATTAQDLFQFYMPIYGHFVGLSASAIGVVVAMAGVSSFVVRAVLPAMTERWGVDRVFTGSLYLSSVAFLAFPLVSSPLMLSVLSLVLGFGMGCSQPVTLMLIFSRAPEGRSGEALGMRITINQFMHVTVPLLFGSLGSALGVAPVFYINSLILAGGGWLNRERPQHIK